MSGSIKSIAKSFVPKNQAKKRKRTVNCDTNCLKENEHKRSKICDNVTTPEHNVPITLCREMTQVVPNHAKNFYVTKKFPFPMVITVY